MVNYIFIDADGHKKARRVTNREEYLALRNTPENCQHFALGRAGEEKEKALQAQFNYNDLLPDGVLKGCCHPSSTFSHDIDCGEETECKRIATHLLEMREEIGLLELSVSARWGLHAICRREPHKTILENMVRVSTLTQTEMDTAPKDLQRILFAGPADADNMLFLDDALFEEPLTVEESEKEFQLLKARVRKRQEEVPPGAKKANKHYRPWEENVTSSGTPAVTSSGVERSQEISPCAPLSRDDKPFPTHYHGIPFTEILKKYWEVNNRGLEPTQGDRDTLTYQLACDLRHICGKNADWLDQVIPCYDGFPPEEKRKKIESALSSELESFPLRLRNVLNALERDPSTTLGMTNGALGMTNGALGMTAPLSSRLSGAHGEILEEDDATAESLLSGFKMPQGAKESVEAVGAHLAIPVVTAICPCIGALATGVVLDVHGQKKNLNLIAYIAGEFASGKGSIDPVIEAWMTEVSALDQMYVKQEDEWRAKKRAAKNKKDQPEEPKLPVRFIPLNNTVANLAERLANIEGKHAFSFTPEADTVAQKWRSAMSDFSIMLRQSYDGSRYDREAKSADAVNVHIKHLLWNVTMCGTPDALFRVVTNYTDGFQSRIAIARTPDNTFAKLDDEPKVLTQRQEERIQQIAHLLPLMVGEIELPRLEQCGREWLEKVRLETMKNDDKVKARQRFRICVTAQRMTCCLMLCKVCEGLIKKHGLNGAESQLKQKPTLWKELLLKAQTPQMLEVYDVIADSLMENALFFFRDRIENAMTGRDYTGNINGERTKRGKNDSIYERLDQQFTFEQAMQQSVAVKGAGVTLNTVQQMLKNWRKQGLVVLLPDGGYRKLN